MKWEVLTSILLGWTGIWQDVSPMVNSVGLGKHKSLHGYYMLHCMPTLWSLI